MIRIQVPKTPPLHRPRSRVKPPRASIDWHEGVALTGKFLGTFVLFASSMNWWYYKRSREDQEREK